MCWKKFPQTQKVLFPAYRNNQRVIEKRMRGLLNALNNSFQFRRKGYETRKREKKREKSSSLKINTDHTHAYFIYKKF